MILLLIIVFQFNKKINIFEGVIK